MNLVVISFKKWFQLKLNKFVFNLPKITQLATAGKMVTLLIVFSISPIGSIKPDFTINLPKHETYETRLVFDQNNVFVLAENKPEIIIEPGVSNYTISQKPTIATSTAVLYPDAHAHTDPAEFRPIYMAAAKQFNIPWQLIEAVH